MNCSNCGNAIRDDAKFCPHCGAVSGPSGSFTAPSGYTGPEAPVSGGKKGKKIGLLVGGGVALAAVAAAVVIVVSGLLASPKGKVEKAFQKSAAAYAQASERIGMPDLDELTQQQSYSQSFALELNSVNSMLVGYDLSSLKGLGLRLDTDLDGPDRKMGAELAAYWGSDDIFNFHMLADGDELYFSIPQITGDVFYGLNTKTMGADLAAMSGDDSVKDLSFSLFDLMELTISAEQTEEMEKAMKAANKALMDSAKVERVGSETISLRGGSTKASVYHMTISEDALRDYVDAVADAMSTVDYVELYEEMLKAMGMSKSDIDYILSDLEGLDFYGELADLVKQFIKILGDMELDIYLSDGYVSAVMWEDRIMGSKVEMALYLGGGKEYVDDIRLELKADGQKIVLESSGDHGAKSGVFTDETTIRGPFPTITSEMRYEPNGGGDNFSWELGIDSMGSLDMEGQLATTKDSMDLHLDEMSLKIMGMEVFDLQMDYYLGPCKGVDTDLGPTKLITKMSLAELEEAGYEMENNIETWTNDLMILCMQRLPEDLLWDLMYGGYYY